MIKKVKQKSTPPAEVFISATSGDLRTVREMVKQGLLTMGCMPVEQDNFPPDYRSVKEMLEDKIAHCDAVVHIVGMRYGAEPDPATLPEAEPRRSYTQMEADIARRLKKKLYTFICPEDFPFESSLEPDILSGACQKNQLIFSVVCRLWVVFFSPVISVSNM